MKPMPLVIPAFRKPRHLLFSVPVIILFLAAVFWFNLHQTANHWKESIHHGLEVHGIKLNRSIEAQFFERYGDVQAFASNASVIRGVVPAANRRERQELVQALNRYVSLYRIYPLILVADRSGRIVAANDRDALGRPIASEALLGRSVVSEPWFRNPMAGRFSEESSKRLAGTFVEEFGTDVWVGQALGRELETQGFSTAIHGKNGELLGVMSNRADSEYIRQRLTEAASDLHVSGYPKGEIRLYDEDGRILLTARDAGEGDFNFTPAVSREGRWEDTVRVSLPVSGLRILDGLGWRLLLAAPEWEAFRQIIRFRTASTVGISLILVFALGGVIWLLRLYDRQVSQNAREREEFTRRMITIQEDERARIARELHDEIGQNLTLVRFEAGALRKTLATPEASGAAGVERARQQVGGIITLADETAKTVRRVCTALRPSILDTMGIEAALQWQREVVEKQSGIACLLEVDPHLPELNDKQRIAVFRVAQEALTNIMKYSEARNAEIILQADQGNVRLEIIDNGKGISADVLAGKTTGFGLVGMRERAKALGGTLAIDRGECPGTRVLFEFPLG